MSKQFTVPIILPADPAAPMEAATKQYVDANAGGPGGGGSEVYIGTDDPIATAPETELWFDTDAVPTAGINGHTIQDQTGTALTQRPTLRFAGTNRVTTVDYAPGERTTVTIDTNTVRYEGGWTARAYAHHDLVYYLSAWWIWTATPDSLSTDIPGTGSSTWRMVGGPAVMTTAQRTAWTSPLTGASVWDSTLNQLFVWEAGAWQSLPKLPKLTTLAGLARGPASDSTAYAITATGTVGIPGLVTVAGSLEFNIQSVSASTTIYIQVIRDRAGVLVMTAGGWNRYTVTANTVITAPISVHIGNCLVGDNIYVQAQRFTAGPGTWQTYQTDARISGVVMAEMGDHT